MEAELFTSMVGADRVFVADVAGQLESYHLSAYYGDSLFGHDEPDVMIMSQPQYQSYNSLVSRSLESAMRNITTTLADNIFSPSPLFTRLRMESPREQTKLIGM